MRAVAAKLRINCLKPPDQIAHLIPRVRPARCGAKMSPAPKRPRFIDEAPACRIEQWTPSRFGVAGIRKTAPAGCAKRLPHDQRLPGRQCGRPPGELELAAFREAHAVALHGTPGEFRIHLARGPHGLGDAICPGLIHGGNEHDGARLESGTAAARGYFSAGCPILIANSAGSAFGCAALGAISVRFNGTKISLPS